MILFAGIAASGGIFVTIFVVSFALAYLRAPTNQALARKQGIELTRWEAMWVSQRVLQNYSLNINHTKGDSLAEPR